MPLYRPSRDIREYTSTTAGVTVPSYAVQIPAGGYFEFPLSGGYVYGGAVEGIWSSATGSARCVELS